MPQHEAPANSFEELWQSVVDAPIERIETGEEDDAVLTADQLVGWLRDIADDCLADALITKDAHAELAACADTYARILATVPPERLHDKLQSLGDDEG